MFTACGGWPTCGTIDSLRKSDKNDYHVIGVDCNPDPSFLNYVDELYEVPRSDNPLFVDKLLQIAVKRNVDIVVPLISDEIDVLSENMEKFEEHCITVALSKDKKMLKIANNKFDLHNTLLANGFDVMPKTLAARKETLDEDLAALGYPNKPVCLKQKNGCGSKGFRIIDDYMTIESVVSRSRQLRMTNFISKDQLVKCADRLGDDFMLQEYIDGHEIGTLCLCNEGSTVYSVTHNNLKMDMSTTTSCMLVNNEEANALVRHINKMFNFDGNIGYDFKVDSNGKLYLLEINPRISATVSLAAKAGLNLVELGILHMLHLPYEVNIVPEYGVCLSRNYGTLYAKDGKPYGQ